MNKPIIPHVFFLMNIVQPLLSWRYIIYADLGSTVLFPLDYPIDSLDPNANLSVDVHLHNKYQDDGRHFSKELIAVYDPFYHNCSVIDENKYECVNTSGQIQITVVNVTHHCAIEAVLVLYHNTYIRLLNVVIVDLINATSTINMNKCYRKCFLYLDEGRNINLACGWKLSHNVSIELNGHTLARGDGRIIYSFDSNRKMNHNIITCFNVGQNVMEINVKYRVFVDVKIRPGSSTINCVPDGNYQYYTFYKWEHQSLYGGHIRYMDGMSNGTLILKNTSYLDTGVYVCTVSNKNGRVKQKGSVEFTHYGPPVFVNEQTEKTKFGRIGEEIQLSFTLYSQPLYNRFDISKANNDSSSNGKLFSFHTLTQTLTVVRYGTITRMKCQLCLLHITIKDRDDFGIYNAWATNDYGTSFIKFRIFSFDDESNHRHTRLYAIICGLAIFLVCIIASHTFNCKKRRVIETPNQTLPERNAYDEIGTVHYHVGNLQTSDNSTEQDISNFSNRFSSSNAAEDVRDFPSNGNDRDSDSVSSTVAVLPVGYENTYQSVIEVQDRPQSHVYNECDRENVQNETQSDVPKVADYINLRF